MIQLTLLLVIISSSSSLSKSEDMGCKELGASCENWNECCGGAYCDSTEGCSCTEEYAKCQHDKDCCIGACIWNSKRLNYECIDNPSPTDHDCKELGVSCEYNEECCGGAYCDSTEGCSCTEEYAECQHDKDCCIGACIWNSKRLNYECIDNPSPTDHDCKELGVSCEYNEECCGGAYCDITTNVCSCTEEYYAECQHDKDCCNGACMWDSKFQNYKCMDNPCVVVGENCDNDEICCTQICDESSKKCECIEEGNCKDDGDCCGDMTCEHNSIYGEWICIDGGCRDINWQCNQNSDCCTNYCNDGICDCLREGSECKNDVECCHLACNNGSCI
eukprot:520757_1